MTENKNDFIKLDDDTLSGNVKFYLTTPQLCPYLGDRYERKIFTTLNGLHSNKLNDVLTHSGFRRSQNIAYRPSCDMCSKCVSVRVNVEKFIFDKKWRRIINKNKLINATECAPVATEERFALLTKYLDHRHLNQGMSGMDGDDFISMIEECVSSTKLIDYRLSKDCEMGKKGQLIGCTLIDDIDDGRSMVYSFFDTDFPKNSLGSFIILDQIIQMRLSRKPYLYLGYLIDGCEKMEYKTRFQPLESLGLKGWQ